MNKTRSLSIFITSVFTLVLCVVVALCVEGADSPDEDSSVNGDLSNIVGVFETVSFVDVSWETSIDSSETETSELSFDAYTSKNDDTSEDASNIEPSSSDLVSSPNYSETSDQSEAQSPAEDNSSEKSSEPHSEEPSKETSKESSEKPSKDPSSEEPSSEESSEAPSSEEPSSEESSEEKTDFPDDVTILSGGKEPFVFFEQDSDEWKDVAYGSDKIGSHGCGPVCMAMIISSITGDVVYPDETAKWSVKNGYYAKGTGTSHGLMTAIAKAYDVPVTTIPSGSWTAVTNALKEGKLIVTRVKNGIFSKNNHFFILRGITADGKILVANSISYEDSVKEWSLSTIKGQVNLGFWVYG